MTIVKDETSSSDGLAIVERYEVYLNYLHPIVQRAPQHHRVLRDEVLRELFTVIGDIYHASKSKQVSRLYVIDARFATLRAFMRFMAQPKVRVLTPDQHAAALRMLSEPGAMLGSWIKKLNGSGASQRLKGQAG